MTQATYNNGYDDLEDLRKSFVSFRRLTLSADPLPNIAGTQRIEAIVVDGRLLDRKALDSLLLDAETAVKRK